MKFFKNLFLFTILIGSLSFISCGDSDNDVGCDLEEIQNSAADIQRIGNVYLADPSDGNCRTYSNAIQGFINNYKDCPGASASITQLETAIALLDC